MACPAYDSRSATESGSLSQGMCNTEVGLLNAYSTRNLGDAAIMSSIVGLCSSGKVTTTLKEPNAISVPGLEFAPTFDGCNSFISVGGDIFNNGRPWFVTRSFVRNVLALRTAPERTILFGQTIPSSCRGVSLRILADTLRQLKAVVVRDAGSAELLLKQGVGAKLTYDSAFTLSPSMDGLRHALDHFQRQNLAPQHTVLLSVRGFDRMYPNDFPRMLGNIAQLSTALIRRGHQVGVLIQSDVGDADSDRAVAAQLRAAVPEIAEVDPLADASDKDPVATLIGLLAIANIVVGVRYHSAVLRLAAGRHPFHLHYSRKGEDLSRRLGLDGCAIDAFDPEAAIPAIEATAQKAFNVRPISEHVRSTFAAAMELAV